MLLKSSRDRFFVFSQKRAWSQSRFGDYHFREACAGRATLRNSVQSSVDSLIAQARDGDPEALGELLQRHRGYLHLLAQRMLGGQTRARLDASDVVQRTCLTVQAAIGEFRGQTAGQFLAWLRQIHEGNVRKTLRRHFARARCRSRGRGDHGGNRVARGRFDAVDTRPARTPGRTFRTADDGVGQAARRPAGGRAFALVEGLPLAQVGELLGRSDKAASALIMRGMATLRKRLEPDS